MTDTTPIVGSNNEFDFIQERDRLLKSAEFKDCLGAHISICRQMSQMVAKNKVLEEQIATHTSMLQWTKPKLNAIKGYESNKAAFRTNSFRTQDLGEQVNNYIFKFEMTEYSEPLVFRVEDRAELELGTKSTRSSCFKVFY